MPVFRKKEKQEPVQQLLRFFKECQGILIRIKQNQVLMQFPFKQRIIVVQVFGDNIFLAYRFILDALGKLRCVYPFVLKLDFDNAATRAVGALATIQTIEDKSPMELFESFYEAQNGIALDGQKRRIVGDMLAEVEGAL